MTLVLGHPSPNPSPARGRFDESDQGRQLALLPVRRLLVETLALRWFHQAMNTMCAAAKILIGVIFCCIARAQDDRLAKLQDGFSRHTTTLDEKLSSDLEKLSSGYAGALKKLQATIQQAGKLEEAVIVRNEIAAVECGKHPLPELVAGTPFSLRKLRGKFTTARQKIEVDHATALTDTAAKMEAALKELEVASTRAGKLDQALAAKQAREELETRADIGNARDLLKVGGRIQSRPALRLRRGGDNLEVLVYYDSRGKVSMKSPVENVREETGGAKERGDTKAKVLGEFVGARGFEVDPYVSYARTFDTRNPEGLVATALVIKTRHEEKGDMGLQLAYDPVGSNPHVSFGEVLPSISEKGTFRLSCRYLIPPGNRALTGLHFVQTVGGPVGGEFFDKAGKWDFKQVVAESSHERGVLLLYLRIAEGKAPADGWDEHVVLGELEIEHLKFSASIQARFEEKGGVSDEYNDPAKQPLFISNGEFVDG